MFLFQGDFHKNLPNRFKGNFDISINSSYQLILLSLFTFPPTVSLLLKSETVVKNEFFRQESDSEGPITRY